MSPALPGRQSEERARPIAAGPGGGREAGGQHSRYEEVRTRGGVEARRPSRSDRASPCTVAGKQRRRAERVQGSLGLSPGFFRTRSAAGAGPTRGWSRGEAGPGSGPRGRGLSGAGPGGCAARPGASSRPSRRGLSARGPAPAALRPPGAQLPCGWRCCGPWDSWARAALFPPGRSQTQVSARTGAGRGGLEGAQEVGRHWGAGVRRRLWETPTRTRPALVCCPGPRARRLAWRGKEGHPRHRPRHTSRLRDQAPRGLEQRPIPKARGRGSLLPGPPSRSSGA